MNSRQGTLQYEEEKNERFPTFEQDKKIKDIKRNSELYNFPSREKSEITGKKDPRNKTELNKQFRWKKIDSKGCGDETPSKRSSFAYELIEKKKILIHGGCDNDRDLGDAFMLNLDEYKWERLYKVEKQIGQALVGHSSILINKGHRYDREAILLFGGWNGQNYSNRTYFIDTKFFEVLDNKENWANYPSARKDHTLAFDKLDDKIYLFGGWNPLDWNYTDNGFNEVWALNSKWHWTKEELYGTPPVSRRGHSCIFSSLPCLSLIIFGGVYGYNKFLDDVYMLDLANKIWTKIDAKGEAPTPRAWHTTNLLGTLMIVFGGLLANGHYSNEVK